MHEMRMGVPKRVHRDPGAEIEISLAVSLEKPSALPLLEREVGARVGRQQRRGHDVISGAGLGRSLTRKPCQSNVLAMGPENESAARQGLLPTPKIVIAPNPLSIQEK